MTKAARTSAFAVLIGLSVFTTTAKANSITYSVDIGSSPDWRLTGSITTDGTIGAFGSADVISYDLFVTLGPPVETVELTPAIRAF